MKKTSFFLIIFGFIFVTAVEASDVPQESIYQVGPLKPVDSRLKVKIGEKAPDFTLKAVSGGMISLHDFKGRKNVVLSFVPAAWTPVCSDQWPGYNIVQEEFEQNDAILIGISVDNIPTLFAWTHSMGKLWFPVLSDFWPHGKTAVTGGHRSSERGGIKVFGAGIMSQRCVAEDVCIRS